MKPCSYCGKDNEDGSVTCAECGTEFSSQPGSVGDPEKQIRFQQILADPVRLFRVLVVVSTVTYVIWYFQLQVGAGMLSEETWGALSWHGYGAVFSIPPGVTWLIFFLFLVVTVGLWTFCNSARLLFAMLAGFLTVMTIFGGIQVDTAFGSFLLGLTNMADGAILIMAYTAPLKERFE